MPPICVTHLTPPGRGAVATLLVEGPDALDVLQGFLRLKGNRTLANVAAGCPTLGYCSLGSQPDRETVEEVVIRRRAADSIELHCHGGYATVSAIQEELAARGCRSTDWCERLARSGQDPIATAAHIALAEARTWRTASILLDQHGGALRGAIGEIRRDIASGDLSAAAAGLERLLERGPVGRHLVEPWQVVLAGPPNAGKSTLTNALVGYDRAIVHHAPGTTRDVVTEAAAIDGWPVSLSDTAGLRDADHPLETAGIHLAKEQLATADLVLLVFDRSVAWSEDDRRVLDSWPDALVINNKCDLPPASAERPPGIATSGLIDLCMVNALTKGVPPGNRASPSIISDARGNGTTGIEELVSAISARLVPNPPPSGAAVPFTADQLAALQSAAKYLAAGDPRGAISLLDRA